MPPQMTTIAGPNSKHKVELYALSTCIWCRKTRQWLEDKGVSYDYIYVDLLSGTAREEVLDILSRWNPRTNFPTLVVDNARVIWGYQPDQMQEALL